MENDLGLLVEEKLSRNFLEEIGIESYVNGENDYHFLSRDQEVLLKLYKIYVRVFLEGQYAVELHPYQKKHWHLLEKVQQNFLKKMKGMEEISSEESESI